MSRLRINGHLEATMTETVLDIKHWGNNLGVRLPAAVARAAHLHADQRVRITVEGERVIITPLHDEPLTLEQRLARFDPERHGGEAMPSDEALGAERW
ncbi:Antitoxin MazE [compost metagenome]